MGMFDSLFIKCPKCKHTLEFQSKSGECLLNKYNKSNLPLKVAIGMNGDIAKCNHCNTNWRLNCNFPKKINVRLIKTKSKADYDGN